MSQIAINRNIEARQQIMGRRTGNWSLSGIWRSWKARRQVTKLQDRSDHLLDDIGVTRDELSWASQLPLTVNAALALEDRAYRRRKEQRHMWL